MRWTGHVERIVEARNAYSISVGEPEGKRPRGRTRSRWKYNIRINLWEVVWEVVDWTHSAQDRDQRWAVVNTVMNRWVP
jgi:hypothetical protein